MVAADVCAIDCKRVARQNDVGDFDVVTDVVKRHYEIDCMTMDELREWYHSSMHFPVEKDVTREELIRFHKKVEGLQRLSMEDLLQECRAKGISTSAAEELEDEEKKALKLINELLFDDRKAYWESKGMPVRRLDIDMAMYLVSEFERIEEEDLSELKRWYRKAGYPDEEDMKKEELGKLCKKVQVWLCLPLSDLHAECAARKIVFVEQPDSEQHRLSLVDKLLFQERSADWKAKGFDTSRIAVPEEALRLVHDYESYKAMAPQEFAKVYADLGLPDVAERSGQLRLVWKLLVWEALPLPALLDECREQGLLCSQGLSVHSSKERCESLVQRLKQAMQVSQAFAQERPQFLEHETFGPASASTDERAIQEEAPVELAGTVDWYEMDDDEPCAAKSPVDQPQQSEEEVEEEGDAAEELLVWAYRSDEPEVVELVKRLIAIIREEGGLNIMDVPEEPEEARDFLQALGFQAPEETEPLMAALQAFRARAHSPRPALT